MLRGRRRGFSEAFMLRMVPLDLTPKSISPARRSKFEVVRWADERCRRCRDSRLAALVSDAHRAAIDERLAEHERSPDDVVSRDQVLAEARRR